MDSRLILFLISVFLPAVLSSQDDRDKQVNKDYRAFQETLDKEVDQAENDPGQSSKNILHPAILPEWIFQFPASDKQTLFAFGISDPGMEKGAAIELATLRAKSLLSLLIQSELNILSDHFISEKNSGPSTGFATKYSNLYQVSAAMLFDTSMFSIVEMHFTSFNEAIVLATYSLGGAGKDSLKTKANVFQLERQKQNVFESEEKYEINSSLFNHDEETTYSYSIHSFNNIFEITSEFNEQSLPFPYYNFRYSAGDNVSNGAFPSNYNSKLIYGLWKSFMEVFLQELYFLSQNPDIYIRQVGDNYADETKNLSRETLQLLHSVKIEKIQLSNNRIFLQLGILK